MDLQEIIELFQSAIFEGSVGAANLLGLNDYVDYIMGYSYILASIIMIVLVGVKVMTYFVNPSGNLDPFVLVRPVLILVALALYQPLVENLLVRPANIVADITKDAAVFVTSSGNYNAFEESYKESITHIQDTSVREDGTPGEGVYEVLEVHPFLEFIHLIILFVASVISGYIMFRYLIFKGIYFVLGVLVLPFSLIPGNQEVLKKWFFGFLAVLLWLPMLTIVQTILILIKSNTLHGGFTQVLLSICLQVVMILAVLRVPRYANMLVSAGSEFGGRFTTGIVTDSVAFIRGVRKSPRR